MLRLALWTMLSAVGIIVATATTVFALFLLDIAATGPVPAGPIVSECRDSACVREAWLIGGSLLLGTLVVVAAVIPAILRSPRTLRAATTIAWTATVVVTAIVVVASAADHFSTLPALLIPVALVGALAVGTHLRWHRRRDRQVPEVAPSAIPTGPAARDAGSGEDGSLARGLLSLFFIALGVDPGE